MNQNPFYYSTIKNMIASFGMIFKNIVYINDFGVRITVPLYYSPKEKFVELIMSSSNYEEIPEVKYTLPRMGFEMRSVTYDSLRMLNPMSRVNNPNDQRYYMYNRVPYNFSFTLYIATVKFEDSLKIVEQIIPFFTPELNLSIKDKNDFEIVTDVPVVMTNVSFDIEYEGSFETKRAIVWQLDFVMKAYLYSNVREQTRIKETIVSMTDEDFSRVYEMLISEVEPRIAQENETHIIKSSIEEGIETGMMITIQNTSSNMDVKVWMSYLIEDLSIYPIGYGSSMRFFELKTEPFTIIDAQIEKESSILLISIQSPIIEEGIVLNLDNLIGLDLITDTIADEGCIFSFGTNSSISLKGYPNRPVVT